MKKTVLLRHSLVNAFFLCFINQVSVSMDIDTPHDHKPPVEHANINPPPADIIVAPAVPQEEDAQQKARNAAQRAKKRWKIEIHNCKEQSKF